MREGLSKKMIKQGYLEKKGHAPFEAHAATFPVTFYWLWAVLSITRCAFPYSDGKI